MKVELHNLWLATQGILGTIEGKKIDKVLLLLLLICASYAIAYLCMEPRGRDAPIVTCFPSPPAPARKKPKLFFHDGTAMSFDFGPRLDDRDKIIHENYGGDAKYHMKNYGGDFIV